MFAATPEDSTVIMTIVRDAYPGTEPGPETPLSAAAPAFIALSVSDLEAATAWYSEVLGLRRVRDVSSADGALRASVLSSDNVVIELIRHRSTLAADDVLESQAHRFHLQGIVKTGLFVTDIDRLFEYLRERQVRTDERIGTDRELGLRFFIFRDPDGNRIQVFEPCAGGCG